MKSLLAFGVIALFGVAGPASAQFGARSGALGGRFASNGISRPLGGIQRPGFTGVIPNRNFSGRGFNGRGFNRGSSRRGVVGYPFAYSIWVPDSFDYEGYQNPYGAPYYDPAYAAGPPAPGSPPEPQQPVIINQYFSTPPPQPQQNPAPAPSQTSNTQAPGDLLATPQSYYLIAYKNHQVYPALAYWVEDKTLHYVTTENTHNQASLDLIDVARSKSLNRDRDVPFTITGQ
jgi:hypothetical protein